MKHTPGPWLMGFDTDTPSITIRQDKRPRMYDHVATVLGQSDQDTANAYLIAAAPELFEALSRTVQRLDFVGACSDNHDYHETKKVITAAHVVIKKARGETDETRTT